LKPRHIDKGLQPVSSRPGRGSRTTGHGGLVIPNPAARVWRMGDLLLLRLFLRCGLQPARKSLSRGVSPKFHVEPYPFGGVRRDPQSSLPQNHRLLMAYPALADSLGSFPSERARKKTCDNLPSPRTLCSSLKAKNGMSMTNSSKVKVKIPFRVPPPIFAMLY
jgi:hypothetical protein